MGSDATADRKEGDAIKGQTEKTEEEYEGKKSRRKSQRVAGVTEPDGCVPLPQQQHHERSIDALTRPHAGEQTKKLTNDLSMNHRSNPSLGSSATTSRFKNLFIRPTTTH